MSSSTEIQDEKMTATSSSSSSSSRKRSAPVIDLIQQQQQQQQPRRRRFYFVIGDDDDDELVEIEKRRTSRLFTSDHLLATLMEFDYDNAVEYGRYDDALTNDDDDDDRCNKHYHHPAITGHFNCLLPPSLAAHGEHLNATPNDVISIILDYLADNTTMIRILTLASTRVGHVLDLFPKRHIIQPLGQEPSPQSPHMKHHNSMMFGASVLFEHGTKSIPTHSYQFAPNHLIQQFAESATHLYLGAHPTAASVCMTFLRCFKHICSFTSRVSTFPEQLVLCTILSIHGFAHLHTLHLRFDKWIDLFVILGTLQVVPTNTMRKIQSLSILATSLCLSSTQMIDTDELTRRLKELNISTSYRYQRDTSRWCRLLPCQHIHFNWSFNDGRTDISPSTLINHCIGTLEDLRLTFTLHHNRSPDLGHISFRHFHHLRKLWIDIPNITYPRNSLLIVSNTVFECANLAPVLEDLTIVTYHFLLLHPSVLPTPITTTSLTNINLIVTCHPPSDSQMTHEKLPCETQDDNIRACIFQEDIKAYVLPLLSITTGGILSWRTNWHPYDSNEEIIVSAAGTRRCLIRQLLSDTPLGCSSSLVPSEIAPDYGPIAATRERYYDDDDDDDNDDAKLGEVIECAIRNNARFREAVTCSIP